PSRLVVEQPQTGGVGIRRPARGVPVRGACVPLQRGRGPRPRDVLALRVHQTGPLTAPEPGDWKMSTPRFTVVIPTRERPETLRHSLRTCIEQQQFDDYEIVDRKSVV